MLYLCTRTWISTRSGHHFAAIQKYCEFHTRGFPILSSRLVQTFPFALSAYHTIRPGQGLVGHFGITYSGYRVERSTSPFSCFIFSEARQRSMLMFGSKCKNIMKLTFTNVDLSRNEENTLKWDSLFLRDVARVVFIGARRLYSVEFALNITPAGAIRFIQALASCTQLRRCSLWINNMDSDDDVDIRITQRLPMPTLHTLCLLTSGKGVVPLNDLIHQHLSTSALKSVFYRGILAEDGEGTRFGSELCLSNATLSPTLSADRMHFAHSYAKISSLYLPIWVVNNLRRLDLLQTVQVLVIVGDMAKAYPESYATNIITTLHLNHANFILADLWRGDDKAPRIETNAMSTISRSAVWSLVAFLSNVITGPWPSGHEAARLTMRLHTISWMELEEKGWPESKDAWGIVRRLAGITVDRNSLRIPICHPRVYVVDTLECDIPDI